MTTALAGGNILVDRIIAQVHATAPTGAFTGLYVRNASLTKINVAFRNANGVLFEAADAVAGSVGIAECGHILTTGDVLTLYTEGVAITGTGPTFTIIGRVLSEGASLAIA